MFLDFVLLFIFTFVLSCFLFTYYHQNKHCLQDENIPTYQIICLQSIHHLWLLLNKCLHWADQLVVNTVSFFLTDHLYVDRFVDNIKYYMYDTCAPGGETDTNDASVTREIMELSNTIYELYIDFWYQNVKLPEEESNCNSDANNNFQFHCKKGIEEALTNFYRLCTEKVRTKKLALELAKEVETHLLNQNVANVRLKTKDEITFLLNLIDDIFIQVLPRDVNLLVTNCNCCKNGAKKHCLQNSSNPVRLFIYNLIVYSLLLPLIDRITQPLYFFYNFIYIASTFGAASLSEFISQFENNDDYYEKETTESAPVPINIDPEDETTEKALLYEAIEESRKELMVFSNIRISNVKISNNKTVSSLSKISPFIDYIIVFNVLECDREMEKQKANLKRYNGQTFLQRTYQVKRRFREFLSFQQKLEKNLDFRMILAKMDNKPSNIQFHSSAFFNYIKSTKINEDSPLVKKRRENLESFLNQLAANKAINESREFCEFLGYKYKLLHEVKQLLNINENGNNSSNNKEPNQKMNGNNFERHLKNLFRIFLPGQAKFGQLSAQIEDVMVNDQICNKYGIMKIQTETNDQNHMVLKHKLDRWAAANTTNRLSQAESKTYSPSKVCDQEKNNENNDEFDHKLISCLLVLLFKGNFVFQTYLVDRCGFFLKSLLIKLRNIFTFKNMFCFYIHYLHVYLVGLNSDSMDTYLTSYERFYGLLKDKDLKELFYQYVQLSEEKIMQNQLNSQTTNTYRVYLCKATFFLCDHLKLFDNLITSFDSQHSNKVLIYKLLQIFRNEIKMQY